MKEPWVCAICHKVTRGYGNNPQPVVEIEGARCCDICNETIVIPARIANMLRRENEQN